jgi:hypothetical protein
VLPPAAEAAWHGNDAHINNTVETNSRYFCDMYVLPLQAMVVIQPTTVMLDA